MKAQAFFSVSKVFGVFFLLLISLTFVSALDIQAEDTLPAGTPWSATIVFTSWAGIDEATVGIDSSSAMTVFSHAGELFVTNKSSEVLSYATVGNTLTFSFAGQFAGSHALVVRTYANGSLVNEESRTIDFAKALTSAERESLQASISNLTSQLQDKNTQIEELKRINSTMARAIINLDSNITDLQVQGKEKGEILDKVQQDLNGIITQQQEAQRNPIAGFFSFAQNGSFGLFLIILVIIAGIAFFITQRGSSIYSSPLIGSKNFNTGISDDAIPSLQKDPVVGAPQWTIDQSAAPRAKPSAPQVSAGDLVKGKNN